MNLTRHFKHTALTITLIYLLSSGLTMVGVGGHAHEHGQTANHASQHSSFICAWMCAASTFVHTADQNEEQGFYPFFEKPTIYTERFLNNLSIFSFYVRPPPISLS